MTNEKNYEGLCVFQTVLDFETAINKFNKTYAYFALNGRNMIQMLKQSNCRNQDTISKYQNVLKANVVSFYLKLYLYGHKVCILNYYHFLILLFFK